MARPLRLEFEDAIYHLFGRGDARQRIFASEQDQLKFGSAKGASAYKVEKIEKGSELTIDTGESIGHAVRHAPTTPD